MDCKEVSLVFADWAVLQTTFKETLSEAVVTDLKNRLDEMTEEYIKIGRMFEKTEPKGTLAKQPINQVMTNKLKCANASK